MKKALLFLLFITVAFEGTAQVAFDSYTSLDALFEKAKKEKKLVFIQLESTECGRCNEVAMMGLESKQLKGKYNVNFLSLKIKATDDLRADFIKKHKLRESMGSFYFDANENLLLKNGITTSDVVTYLDWADKALENVPKFSNYQDLENIYRNGDRTAVFLEKYIQALKDLDKDADAVVETYVGQMTIDSLKTPRIITFVIEQGLPLSAPARKAIYSLNPDRLTDSLWCLMPLSKRISINNKTISKTFAEAVKKRNRPLIYELNNFTRNTYKPDYQKGNYVSELQLINFFKAIRDTTSYFRTANRFADNLVSTKLDTLKAWDNREREKAFSSGDREKRFTVPSGNYATELNNLSWNYYQITNNPMHLEKALKWTEHAILIHKEVVKSNAGQNAGFFDTYAHLLYKLQRYDEAIEWQTKAVDAQKAANMKSTAFEEEREKMKNRKL